MDCAVLFFLDLAENEWCLSFISLISTKSRLPLDYVGVVRGNGHHPVLPVPLYENVSVPVKLSNQVRPFSTTSSKVFLPFLVQSIKSNTCGDWPLRM